MPKKQPARQPGKTILYLTTLSEWGGAQTYVFDLATSLRHNYHIAVAAGGGQNGQLIKKLVRLNIRAYYLKNLQRPINFYRDWSAFWDIIKLIKTVKPDIVHLNSSKAGVLGALAAKCCRIKKVVYTVHGLVLNEPLSLTQKTFYRLAEWFSAKFKDHFICVSEYDKKSLLANKIAKPKKISVIYNGLELQKLNFYSKQEARQRLFKLIEYRNSKFKIQNSKFLIGTIANLYANKGLGYLIEAAKRTISLLPVAKFIIIGDGPERKKITELITSYKLDDKVVLSGILEQAHQYLKAFDIFVLSSVKEGLAYTLIEAQAAGLPTIATNVGGNPEIITHNKNGILIPPKDFNALAENIINLAANQNKQQEFTKNSLTNAQRFSLEKMIEETKKIYQN